MIKASMLALGAVIALAFAIPQQFSISAYAASTNPIPGIPPSSSEPDDPGNPGNPGGNGPDLPTPPPAEQTANMAEVCNGALHALKKVPEKLVVAFADENGVSLVPVCNNGPARQADIDSSQALPLQNAIAANPALMKVLTAHGFTAEDVVGVILVKGVATLYVHKHA